MELFKLDTSSVTIARRKEEVHVKNSALSDTVLSLLCNMEYLVSKLSFLML